MRPHTKRFVNILKAVLKEREELKMKGLMADDGVFAHVSNPTVSDLMDYDIRGMIKELEEDYNIMPTHWYNHATVDADGRPSAVFTHVVAEALSKIECPRLPNMMVLGSQRSKRGLLEHKPMLLLEAPNK